MRTIKERFGRLHPVVSGAAAVDADVAAMLGRIATEFYENQRAVVESLAKKKALRKGLDVARASYYSQVFDFAGLGESGGAFADTGLGPALSVVSDGGQAIEYLSGTGPYADRREYPVPEFSVNRFSQ